MERLPADYNRWTKDALVKRIKYLEAQRASAAQPPEEPTPAPEPAQKKQKTDGKKDAADKKTDAKKDPAKKSTRLIALKLAYIGRNYGGFEYQPSVPTIEEELWKALVKSCLIVPDNPDEVRWEKFDYSKSGRTDRGVSAFGQVIGIKVRSNRPLPKEEQPTADAAVSDQSDVARPEGGSGAVGEEQATGEPVEEETAVEKPFDDHTDEINYCRILNRLLPLDIKVLAWCPSVPADFSARHHCRERQYRYFFTQPAYLPVPRNLENPKAKALGVKDGWLDIEAMREAAKKFEGVHDFRNFCKIDPSKLVKKFDRRIFECDVVEVEDAGTALPFLDDPAFNYSGQELAAAERKQTPKVYYFHVRGSAFLWHQIRCMVAVLFTVGQGLEAPSIIDDLLDIEKVPRRPNYTLASDSPLVLWDTVFPDITAPRDDNLVLNEHKDAMPWIYVGDENPLYKHGAFGVVDQLWQFWRQRKIDEILSSQLLNLAVANGDTSRRLDKKAPQHVPLTQRTFEGADKERFVGTYRPILKLGRLPAPEETYDREARRKGFKDADDWRQARHQKWADNLAAEDDE